MKLPRDRRLERACLKVLFNVPFFAPGLARLNFQWSEGVKTACTDGKCLKFNPSFFDKLKDEELPTILCHEVCHCMFGHLWRVPDEARNNPELWDVFNQAADHAVNLMLKEWSQTVRATGLAEPFPFPQPETQWCMDPKYSGMSEEQIYGILKAQPKQQGGQGQKPGQGQGRPEFGEFEPAPQNGQAQQAQTSWTATLLQSARIAQQQGDLPGSLKRLVEKESTAQVPWWELLRSWLREQCSDDWDFQHPALEYSDSGFLLPSMRSDKCGPVIFATDTSGSIDAELLAKFRAEKQSCLDEMRPSSFLDIYCDSAVTKVLEYRVGQDIERDAPGGGGTCFEPVFQYVADKGIVPKCLVYLTDLYGTFPKEDPGYPVLWVVWGENPNKAPFGYTVKYQAS